ncbi:hypothetical protein BFL38_04960 [Brachyspira hampsonii]|uniref:DUF2589 domain-containing protein n=1 Tax=Brachyspira hampsonii TaxID=1287055 RepID=A0A1E5ND62_9SPIR|nr:DUF2589 domain-containing protein [Brachyspira hampsonii]OEJ14085.1 hypothetical protein BFL38_04960 [Brachyspira hampsonii]
MGNTVIQDQFTGLPMSSLIGGPLEAVAEAQLKLANSTKEFIETVGFEKDDKSSNKDEYSKLRIVRILFTRNEKTLKDGTGSENKPAEYEDTPVEMKLDVPLLSIVKVPSLFVDTVDITFDMEVKTMEEVKSSDDSNVTTDTSAKLGFGIFSSHTNIKGSISSHKENTRKTDTSAKYHVEVHASDQGMPEGLARVFDILNATIAPTASNNSGNNSGK